MLITAYNTGFTLRILVAGERCNVTGKKYYERGSTSERKIVIGYRTLARELCIVNREFSNLRCLINTMITGVSSFTTTKKLKTEVGKGGRNPQTHGNKFSMQVQWEGIIGKL